MEIFESPIPFEPTTEPVNMTPQTQIQDNIIEEIIIDNNTQENNQQLQSNIQIINKEDFNNFIKSFNILKNFTNVVNMEKGVTYFISDSKVFIIQFDCNSPKISLILPDPEKQVSQLSFLSKSSAVQIKEEDKIYKFWNDENIKFAVRKGIHDPNTMIPKEAYNNTYNAIKGSKLVFSYNFKDNTKIKLNTFLSIIKTVKNPHINLYTEKNSNNKDDVTLSIGELNGSGVFELLKITDLDISWLYSATNSTSSKIIDTLIDKSIFNNDYSSLNIEVYCSDPNKLNQDGEKPDMDTIYILIEAIFTENNYKMKVIHRTGRNIRES